MKKVTRYCVVCENSLSGNDTGKMHTDFDEVPEKAVVFTSQGSAGSEIICDEECHFEICICDGCLKTKRGLLHKFFKENDSIIACGKW